MVERVHGMDEVRVRFPVGPPKTKTSPLREIFRFGGSRSDVFV